ncbi:MAG: YHYH protein [Verrucomicrobiales bacterium]|nr:YHYH protein [Verrucomicrobiales bacterium]
MKKRSFIYSVVSLLMLGGATVDAQGPGGPPNGMQPPRDGRGAPGSGRQHTATEAAPLDLVPATEEPPARTEVEIRKRGRKRSIESNGMPNHLIGEFPNPGNPNVVAEQDFDIEIPSRPEVAEEVTWLQGNLAKREFKVFGITLDGVFFEPGAGEFWMGRPSGEWNYEALGGAVPLGLDTNYAHVQPGGKYHYHGMPTGLMKRLGYEKGDHSPLIGWAADGFPIYAVYGYEDAENAGSGVVEMKTSFRLKEGSRPGGDDAPGGEYDGAFFADYEYVPGLGTLDECNGRFCVTPEFPDGTYAYFLTTEWPVVPRALRGTPSQMRGATDNGPGEEGRRPPGGPGGMRPPGGGPPPR